MLRGLSFDLLEDEFSKHQDSEKTHMSTLEKIFDSVSVILNESFRSVTVNFNAFNFR